MWVGGSRTRYDGYRMFKAIHVVALSELQADQDYDQGRIDALCFHDVVTV